MFYFDVTMLVLLPALIFAMYAQRKVQTTFRHYVQERTAGGVTGRDIARQLLDSQGLRNIPVEMTGGNSLDDHYDPKRRVVRLSRDVYGKATIAAAGVAAHEVGHAIQHSQGYLALELRNNLVPIASFGSSAALPLFFVGFLFATDALMLLGIWFFVAALIFHLVTLPVEFNASQRAVAGLAQNSYLTQAELPKVKAVLNAAALTYVAAVAVSAAQLIRLVLLRGARR